MPRFLLIVPSSPFPISGGGEQRTTLLHRALSRLGQVDLFVLRSEEELGQEVVSELRSHYGLVGTCDTPHYAELGWWGRVRKLHPNLVDRMAHHLGSKRKQYRPYPQLKKQLREIVSANSYDAIITRWLKTAAITGALELQPVVVDIDDLDFDVWKSRLNGPNVGLFKRLLIRHTYGALKRVIPELVSRCTAAWLAKESDVAALRGGRLSVLPNIPYTPSDKLIEPVEHAGDSRIILTISNMTNQHNVAGIDHFIKVAWPVIRSRMPEARFRIVGTWMTEALKKRWGAIEGVEPVGFVDDLRQIYAQAAFTVAAVWSGGGTNIKVLESLQYGRTCVLTMPAHRGYEEELKDGDAVLVAKQDSELADLSIRLMTNPEERKKLETNGHRAVLKRFSYERFSHEVADTISAVIKTGHPVESCPV